MSTEPESSNRTNNIVSLTVFLPNGDTYQRGWYMTDASVESMLLALGTPYVEAIQPAGMVEKVQEYTLGAINDAVYNFPQDDA